MKHLTLLFSLVLLLSLTIPSVQSFGIAPSQYTFDIDEDINQLRLRIINSQQEDLMLSIHVEGDLASYIDIDETTVTLRPSEHEKILTYTIAVPETLPPGMNHGSIVIKDITTSSKSGSSMVEANVEVKQKIMVFSPYPDRFVEGDLFVQAIDVKQPVIFSIHAKNKGSIATDLSGSILVKTPANAEIGRIPISTSSLDALSAKKIRASFDKLEHPGVYIAQATLNYADKSFTLEKQFMIGNKEIEVTAVDIDSFRLGEIVKLQLGLMNNWNQKINDIYAEVEILDETGTIVDTVKTVATSINAYEGITLDAYWDTEGVSIGNYDIAVRIYYDDIVSEYYFEAVVGTDRIKVSSDSLTGNVVDSENEEESSIYTIVILLILAIVVMNIAWFVIIKKRLLKK